MIASYLGALISVAGQRHVHVLALGLSLFAMTTSNEIATAGAANQVIAPIDSGWYWHDAGGYYHEPSNTNFIVGQEDITPREYHNFFVFDVSSISRPITAATFRAELTYFGASVSEGQFGTWTLYDVTTSIAELRSAASPPATFADLADGQVYGTYQFRRGGDYSVSVDFNSAAISAMNAGGLWAFGGAVTDLGEPYDLLFNGSDAANSNPRLLLTIPEPATATLAAAMLLLFGPTCVRGRRQHL